LDNDILINGTLRENLLHSLEIKQCTNLCQDEMPPIQTKIFEGQEVHEYECTEDMSEIVSRQYGRVDENSKN
jgi:hypothetical protein